MQPIDYSTGAYQSGGIYGPVKDGSTGLGLPEIGGGYGVATNIANQYGGLAQQAANTKAPTADLSYANQARQQGMQANALLGQSAAGNGPQNAIANAQFGQSLSSSIDAQQAAAGSGRTGGAALAQRAGAMQGAGMASAGAANAAGTYGGMTGNAQGQYAGSTLGQQNLDANTAMSAAQMQERQNQINQQGALGYSGLANDIQQAQLTDDTNAYNAQLGLAQQQAKNKSQLEQSLIGGGVGAAAGFAGLAFA